MSKALKNKTKLNDAVDVVADYGADPTGVADSTAAFNSAIATGKRVYAPEGKYLITAPLTLNNSITGSSDPYAPNQYDSGLVLFGAGMNKTQLLCGFSAPALTGATAQGLINLPASTTLKYRIGAYIAHLSIFPSGTITNTHGILMNANWYPIFESVRVKGMPGNGFYSPLRTDLSANTDDYQNTLAQFKSCVFDGNYYGWYGESGLGCAASKFVGNLFANNSRSGVRIGGVLGQFENCSFGANGVGGSLAGVDTGGLIIDTMNSTTSRNFSVRGCEFESNYNANLWVRSCIGFDSDDLRLNAQSSTDGGATLITPVQVLLGDTGTSIRSANFRSDISKSPAAWVAALSMYKIRGADTAGVNIYEPYGTKAVDNTTNFVVMDTTTTTGTFDGVHLLTSGLYSQTRISVKTPIVAAYHSTGYSLTTGVYSTIIPDTELIDNAAAFASGIYTAPSSGYYRAGFTMRINSITAGKEIRIRVRLNGGFTVFEKYFIASGATSETYSLNEVVGSITAAQTLSIEVYHNLGANLAIVGGQSANSLTFEQVQ